MRIVADENIPQVREAFGEWGRVETYPASAIDPDAVRDADVLLVRSVTQVNKSLLDGSRVGFVASATSGIDHIDLPYLGSKNISFCSAPGSNADSVAEYVIVALHALRGRLRQSPEDTAIGIVGIGEVGSRVSRLCEALGLRTVWNDPPLERATGDPRYRPLSEIAACDIISLHVPLVESGPDRTLELVGAEFLSQIRDGATLINTCRGDVVDENALKIALHQERLGPCVIDVWRNEPSIDSALLDLVAIGTPHIAGYSEEAKLRGTQMIYEGVARFLDADSNWDYHAYLPPPQPIHAASSIDWGGLLRAAYDIKADDAALRRVVPERDGGGFHGLRKNYPPRREFSAIQVASDAWSKTDARILEQLGFGVELDPMRSDPFSSPH